MRLRRPEPHTLVGAYAMDAVAGADKARFNGTWPGARPVPAS